MRYRHTLKAGLLALTLGASLNSLPVYAARDYRDLDSCASALSAMQDAQATVSASPETQPEKQLESLRVMSWNVMKYRREGATTLLERLAEDADLVALQEAIRDVVTPATGLEHRYFADGYARGGEQSGVELRSRREATLSCSLSFREPWLRTPKAVLLTHHDLGEQGLVVVSLHAINFTFWITDLREQFAAVGRLLQAHAGPAIVMGDFNNWNAYRQAVINSFAARHGLEIVEFEPDLRSRHLGVPVDGLLQRGFDTVSSSAIPTIASDHHPIQALLKPRATPGPAVGNPAGDAAPAARP